MRTVTIASVAMTLILLAGLAATPAQADVSFDFFYSNLSPHGSWLVSAEYGRVWQPRVYANGWNPYYDGRWAYTDVGWTWVSDYSWGSVPYHYGTWVLDPALGWVWVPGYTWAPAWVVFRTGPDAIGWAPVAPGFSVGVSLGAFAPVSGSFVFVSTHDFAAPRIGPCVLPEARRAVAIERTRVVPSLSVEHDVIVSRGPDVHIVERASGKSFRPLRVETVARVAPFASVRREELAIAPEHRGHRVHAAEPVSAGRPLPSASDRASLRPEEPVRPSHRQRDVEQAPSPERRAPQREPTQHNAAQRPAPASPTHGPAAKPAPHAKNPKPNKQKKNDTEKGGPRS